MVGLTTTEPSWLGGPGWEHRQQEQRVVQKNSPTTFGFHLPPLLSRPWELPGEGGGV